MTPDPTRLPRRLALAALGATTLPAWLAGCATPPPSPLVLYRLPLEAPGAPPAAAQPIGKAVTVVVDDTHLPTYLDRDRLLLSISDTATTPASRARWAEPLRDAIPRLMRRDLADRLGPDRVAGPAVPPGWVPTHRVRVSIEALDITPDQRAVRLSAQWWLLPPSINAGGSRSAIDAGRATSHQAAFTTQAASTSIDDLVLAHRQALRRLADAVADSVSAAAGPRL